MSTFISQALRAVPVGTSLFFYATSAEDASKGKPVQGIIRAGFGWGAKMISSLFESPETVAQVGKATALAASTTLCISGLENLRKAKNEKSTLKALKAAVQLTVGAVTSGVVAFSDSKVVSAFQNSLTIAGMSAVLACEGAVCLYKGQPGLLRLTIGATGLGCAMVSMFNQPITTSS